VKDKFFKNYFEIVNGNGFHQSKFLFVLRLERISLTPSWTKSYA